MPPLRPLSSLEELCSSTFADHLLDVLSSWYATQKVKLNQLVEDPITGHFTTVQEDSITGDSYRDMTYLERNFILANCYKCEKSYCGAFHVHDDNNVGNNKLLQKVMSDTEKYRYRYTFKSECRCTKEPDHSIPGNQTDVIPVPLQDETETPTTVSLISQLKHYLSRHISMPVRQDILSTVLNRIAERVQLPRPREVTSFFNQDEDLDFISSLSFLLRASLTCLLCQSVNALDFTSVSHLVFQWWKLCSGGRGTGVTLNEQHVSSSDFDIFGYALDERLPELRTLKYLKLPHCVHDNFLRKVAFLCPNLETLILRCSLECPSHENIMPTIYDIDVLTGHRTYDIDDPKIYFRGCLNLVTLELPESVHYRDMYQTVCEFVSRLPNLRRLIGVSMMGFTRRTDSICKGLRRPTKLTLFCHEGSIIPTDYSKHPMQLSDIFPQVKELWLDTSVEDSIKILKQFPTAEKVSLELSIHDYCPEEGLKNLTSLNLDLIHGEWWCPTFLVNLSERSPNLTELTLKDNTVPVLDGECRKKCSFPNLRTLKLHDVTEIVPECLLAILSVCPGILWFELIMVDDYEKYTDDNQFAQLDEGTFQTILPYLQKLHTFVYMVTSDYSYEIQYRDEQVNTNNLTLDSLQSLISNCPDLKYVSQLGTWDVAKEEVAAVRQEVKDNNWDLELVYDEPRMYMYNRPDSSPESVNVSYGNCPWTPDYP